MIQRSRAALAVLMALFSLGAITQASAAPKEKKIVYSLSGEAETLDPTKNSYSLSSIVLQNLFHGLYKMGADGSTTPAIASGCTIDATGTKYVFTLRDSKWSDGKALTAADFEYSWKRVLSPETASKAAFYLYYLKNGKAYNDGKATADQVGVKATGPKTLEVTLESPTPYFLDLLCVTAYFPVRKDVVEAAEPWTKSAKTYVCNGPFLLAEIKPKEMYVLKKNPNYVDAAKVKLDAIDMLFIEAPETELAAYMSGSIDVADNLSAEALAAYKNKSDYHAVPRIGELYLDLNVEKAPFGDARVRKAFSISISREQLTKNILQIPDRPAYGIVPFGIPYATKPGKDYRDVVGNDLVKEDVAAAQKLLADAGFPGGKGLPPITITVRNNQSERDLAQGLQAMWKKNLGAETTIVTWESKVYWDEIGKGNFMICRDGWTGDYPDPMTMLEIFTTEGNQDDTRWVSPDYDKLIADNKVITDKQKRLDNFVKAEKLLLNEASVIPLYSFLDTFLAKPNVKGVTKNFIGHTIFEYASVE
jgi:oligopeptide transport system substrate-binding protein